MVESTTKERCFLHDEVCVPIGCGFEETCTSIGGSIRNDSTRTKCNVSVHVSSYISVFCVECKTRSDTSRYLESNQSNLREQMQQEMKKELKVVFANEEGIDQGGVKESSFSYSWRSSLILCTFLSSFHHTCSHTQNNNNRYGMWIRNKKSGTYWFAAHNELMSSSDDLNNYFLTGIALGLCVYNGVLLDIDFPNILYKKLLSEPIGLPDLKDFMPSEYEGLMKLLQYDKDDIEDVFCLNFEVTVKDFGTVTTHELVKGGSDKEVTLKNKCEYVDLICDFYLNKRVDAQFKAFARGFATLVDGKSFEFFTSSELDLLVAGETELDFKAMEQAALYEGGQVTSSVLRRGQFFTV